MTADAFWLINFYIRQFAPKIIHWHFQNVAK